MTTITFDEERIASLQAALSAVDIPGVEASISVSLSDGQATTRELRITELESALKDSQLLVEDLRAERDSAAEKNPRRTLPSKSAASLLNDLATYASAATTAEAKTQIKAAERRCRAIFKEMGLTQR